MPNLIHKRHVYNKQSVVTFYCRSLDYSFHSCWLALSKVSWLAGAAHNTHHQQRLHSQHSPSTKVTLSTLTINKDYSPSTKVTHRQQRLLTINNTHRQQRLLTANKGYSDLLTINKDYSPSTKVTHHQQRLLTINKGYSPSTKVTHHQ